MKIQFLRLLLGGLLVPLAIAATQGGENSDSPAASSPKIASENLGAEQREGKILVDLDVECGRGEDQVLKLDMARPANLSQKTPCIVVIHGGAWRGGGKKDHAALIRGFANAGVIAVSVEYRLAPKYKFPAQIEDVKCAVRYLRANAARLKLDSDRIAAVGYSAGAHLAMLLGTTEASDGLEGSGGNPTQSSKVNAVVSYFGPVDLSLPASSPESVGWVKDFVGASLSEKPEAYKRASPLSYVSKGDAPMLLYQGTSDPLVSLLHATRMAEAMEKAKVPGRVQLLSGAGHGWGGTLGAYTDADSAQFLREILK